jgi:hypothetical protein
LDAQTLLGPGAQGGVVQRAAAIAIGLHAPHLALDDGGIGDLGKFPAGQMVDEFEAAVKALEPGQRSGIFRTPFGFHIAELRGRIPPAPAPFEEIRETLERTLTLMNRHEAFVRAAADMRSRAQIQYVP